MAISKDYGLAGVADNVQYGKNGGVLTYQSSAFTFTDSYVADSYSSVVANDFVAEGEGFTINSNTGSFSILNTSISLQQENVLRFDGTSAVIIPSGLTSERPSDPVTGMLRINTDTTPYPEYFNGTDWGSFKQNLTYVGTGGVELNLDEANNILTVSLDTVPVSSGGTGLNFLQLNQLLIGNGDNLISQSAALTFESIQKHLIVGDINSNTSLVFDGMNGIITCIGPSEDEDLTILPSGEGNVVIGGVGSSSLMSGSGENLALVANNASLSLQSQVGDINMVVADDSKVSISGPNAATYASGLADNDLVNKYYVDSLVGIVNGGSF